MTNFIENILDLYDFDIEWFYIIYIHIYIINLVKSHKKTCKQFFFKFQNLLILIHCLLFLFLF